MHGRLTLLALLALTSSAFAEAPNATAPQCPPHPLGHACNAAVTKAEHLRAAARHLEAAGMTEDATLLRHRAGAEAARQRAEKVALLAKKTAELERLATEVQQLGSEVGSEPQILAEIRLLEVSRTKLQDLGFDFSGRELSTIFAGALKAAVPKNAGFIVLGASQRASADGLMCALVRDQIARELAAPKLTMLSNRQAYLHVGGEVPLLDKGGKTIGFKKIGTTANIHPHLLDSGKIRAAIQLQHVECIDNSVKKPGEPTGAVAPDFRTAEVDFGVEVEPGQTVLLTGLRQLKEQSEKVSRPKCATQAGEKACDSEAACGANQCAENPSIVTHTEEVELVVLVRLDTLDEPPPAVAPTALPPTAATPAPQAGQSNRRSRAGCVIGTF